MRSTKRKTGSVMEVVTNDVLLAAGPKIEVSPLRMWESPAANAAAMVVGKGPKSSAVRRESVWVITPAEGGYPEPKKAIKAELTVEIR